MRMHVFLCHRTHGPFPFIVVSQKLRWHTRVQWLGPVRKASALDLWERTIYCIVIDNLRIWKLRLVQVCLDKKSSCCRYSQALQPDPSANIISSIITAQTCIRVDMRTQQMLRTPNICHPTRRMWNWRLKHMWRNDGMMWLDRTWPMNWVMLFPEHYVKYNWTSWP